MKKKGYRETFDQMMNYPLKWAEELRKQSSNIDKCKCSCTCDTKICLFCGKKH